MCQGKWQDELRFFTTSCSCNLDVPQQDHFYNRELLISHGWLTDPIASGEAASDKMRNRVPLRLTKDAWIK
ncbi:hypothetical protein BTVI_56301 [Pitangus sulphuratus]|nr:hypothetical protein BTVI_56301 [Pitangus sulphuratus]